MVVLWDEICPYSKEFLTSKFLVLVGSNVFLLLRPVEERERMKTIVVLLIFKSLGIVKCQSL